MNEAFEIAQMEVLRNRNSDSTVGDDPGKKTADTISETDSTTESGTNAIQPSSADPLIKRGIEPARKSKSHLSAEDESSLAETGLFMFGIGICCLLIQAFFLWLKVDNFDLMFWAACCMLMAIQYAKYTIPWLYTLLRSDSEEEL